jgi:hypothetical protein
VVAFADVDGNAQLVGATTPLPVALGQVTVAPLAGIASASGLVGPFAPGIGRAIILTLQGTWAGTIKVTRSTDSGTTKLPLTIAGSPWAQFTANCCEAVWDESDATARLYLDIALTSGSVTYRLAQ